MLSAVANNTRPRETSRRRWDGGDRVDEVPEGGPHVQNDGTRALEPADAPGLLRIAPSACLRARLLDCLEGPDTFLVVFGAQRALVLELYELQEIFQIALGERLLLCSRTSLHDLQGGLLAFLPFLIVVLALLVLILLVFLLGVALCLPPRLPPQRRSPPPTSTSSW